MDTVWTYGRRLRGEVFPTGQPCGVGGLRPHAKVVGGHLPVQPGGVLRETPTADQRRVLGSRRAIIDQRFL